MLITHNEHMLITHNEHMLITHNEHILITMYYKVVRYAAYLLLRASCHWWQSGLDMSIILCYNVVKKIKKSMLIARMLLPVVADERR